VIPAPQQPGDNVLTRVVAKMSHSLPKDRDQVMFSVSISRDDPGSLSSLPERSALFVSFFSFTGATATSKGWSLGSAAMPAVGAGAGAAATAVPAGAAGTTPVAAAAVVPVGVAVTACWAGGAAGQAGGGSASCHACCFLSPPFPFRALNQAEQGSSLGVGQTPARCGDLC